MGQKHNWGGTIEKFGKLNPKFCSPTQGINTFISMDNTDTQRVTNDTVPVLNCHHLHS